MNRKERRLAEIDKRIDELLMVDQKGYTLKELEDDMSELCRLREERGRLDVQT